MNDELKAWAASPGPAPLPAELQQPDSIALRVLIEVIADDQMRHVAGGVGTHQPHPRAEGWVIIYNVN